MTPVQLFLPTLTPTLDYISDTFDIRYIDLYYLVNSTWSTVYGNLKGLPSWDSTTLETMPREAFNMFFAYMADGCTPLVIQQLHRILKRQD